MTNEVIERVGKAEEGINKRIVVKKECSNVNYEYEPNTR